MVIKINYYAPTFMLLVIVIMVLVPLASSQLRSSSAYNFDPDYPVGTPPILGGTGYVTEVTDGDGWHTDGGAIGFGQQCTEAAACGKVYKLYHPGEDWNFGSGTADVKKPVYAIAYGRIVDISYVLLRDENGKDLNYGSGIVIEHILPSGEKIYSVYEHIDITSGLKKGDYVGQGDQIGKIRDISSSGLSPHLHFEIRTRWEGWTPNSKLGYYSSQEDIAANGFIDPSLFLDFHRGSLSAALTGMLTGNPGFGIPGFGLPSKSAEVASPKTGNPGFGKPLLPSPASGASSSASNKGPYVPPTTTVTKVSYSYNVPGDWIFYYSDAMAPWDKPTTYTLASDGFVYDTDPRYGAFKIGEWSQNGNQIDWLSGKHYYGPWGDSWVTGGIRHFYGTVDEYGILRMSNWFGFDRAYAEKIGGNAVIKNVVTTNVPSNVAGVGPLGGGGGGGW